MNIKPKAGNKANTPYKKREKPAPKKITESYLHNSGLYYLQRFSASSEHFRSVMMRKVKKSCMHHTDQDYDACAVMVDKLVENGVTQNFNFIKEQSGMFSFLGIDKDQVQRLQDEFSIYVVGSSRINVAAISPGNVDYLAQSIAKVL